MQQGGIHGKGTYLCQALNLWLFSYLGNGMNLADMAALTYNPHYYKTKGSEFSFQRSKTAAATKDDIIIYVPLIPRMKDILSRYAAKPEKGVSVFPFILAEADMPQKTAKRIEEWNKRIGKRIKHARNENEVQLSSARARQGGIGIRIQAPINRLYNIIVTMQIDFLLGIRRIFGGNLRSTCILKPSLRHFRFFKSEKILHFHFFILKLLYFCKPKRLT